MKTDWLLTRTFLETHTIEATRLLEGRDPASSAAILAPCAPHVAMEVLRRMDPPEAARVLVRLPRESSSRALRELPLASASRLLRLIDDPERSSLLAAVPEETGRSLRLALNHPADTAGAMMDSAVLALPVEMTVGDARRRVRRRAGQARFYLYLVDGLRRPVGVITLRELMHEPRQTSLAAVMRAPVAQLPARARAEAILAHPGWRELHALPVVDDEGVLVGLFRRETFEKLRAEAANRDSGSGAGLGVAFAEMLWTLTAALVGELAAAVQPPTGREEERHEAER